MSVLWETEQGGTRYSVRTHGASLRLYSNGVFHSQWNPERPFAGGVWDCLSLPALYRPPEALATVLVLGVGGGAVLRQLGTLLPSASITGVEIDPVHLDIASRWFGVADRPGKGAGRVELIEADACRWLANRTGAPFDLVIDDLFGHAGNEPERAVALESHWVSLLASNTAAEGLLVVNAIDGRELKRAAPVFGDAGFRYGRRLSLAAWDNVIGVLSRTPLHSRDWSRRLEASGLPAAARRQARAIDQQTLRGLP